MSNFAIVTDSTADMPLSFYKENDISMVPLYTRFGEKVYKDWLELPPREFFKKLEESNELPKTSQPSVIDFKDVYNQVGKDVEGIISVHLSSKLSGTIKSAEIAKDQVDINVEIVDTKIISIGIALILLALLEDRNNGISMEEALNHAREIAEKITLLASLDTLKYLELGGRIGKAQAMLGTLLKVKPIITLEDGIVAPYKKAKGTKKSLNELYNGLMERIDPEKELFLGLAHANSTDNLDYLESLCKESNLKCETKIQSWIGSVIGTYAGPGAVAMVFYQE